MVFFNLGIVIQIEWSSGDRISPLVSDTNKQGELCMPGFRSSTRTFPFAIFWKRTEDGNLIRLGWSQAAALPPAVPSQDSNAQFDFYPGASAYLRYVAHKPKN